MPDVRCVLIADKVEPECREGLEALADRVVYAPDASGDDLVAAIRSESPTVLVVRSTKVPSDALAAGEDLKLVIRAGSGFDNVDTAFAAERDIAVCNCPGMNAVAVAELTLGHLIALDRRLPEQDAALKVGKWDKKGFGKARGLKGRSVLVVGTGAIGIEVIRRLQAFGMDVWAQSRSLTEEVARALGVKWIPFTREALLEAVPRFDVVTVHVPATPESRGMCDGRFFEALRDGAYFINTSRGEIVDETALAAAVKNRGVRAALDVYQAQPSFKQGDWKPAIANVPGVYCSHHSGASTDQAQLAVALEVARIVRVYRDSGTFEHCVNGVRGALVG
jgi:D-3-phosphoglycerate dehydrogenase